jgi:Fe-S cluster assembly iron-binding protein IscA
VPVVVDSVSLGFIRGSALDWDDENMLRQAFVIVGNPQAEASCGCKQSFAVKPV